MIIIIIGDIINSEWRVKVSGNQSTMRLGRKTGARSLEVAPLSSDLSPHWLNMNED